MGQQASKPDPNVSLKVIGCGMSRTGTTSFGMAIETLVGGPVYHGGTDLCLGTEDNIKTWIDTVKHTPIRTPEDREVVYANLKKLLSGYTCCTDMPPLLFTEELVHLFPDAKVICSTRDADKWWESMEPVVKNTDRDNRVLAWIFAFLPTLRWWQDFVDAVRVGRFTELYYSKGYTHMHRGTYDDHMEYIDRVVPKDRLHFYEVKDGWEPLCKILDVPVPDEPFPRMNDAVFVEQFFLQQIKRGLMAWAGVGALTAISIAVGVQLWKRA